MQKCFFFGHFFNTGMSMVSHALVNVCLCL